MKKAALFLFLLTTVLSCREDVAKNADWPGVDADTTAHPAPAPVFNPDSAYANVAAQVGFGPRVPGTAAHRDCAAWLYARLATRCDTVYRQETVVTGGDGKRLPCINLIGVINPAAKKRVLILAHWDTRPWADEDTKDRNKPIDGADDGASGPAVMLEVARVLHRTGFSGTGVDFLLTDVEDYGRDEWGDDSYCLGTQYWAKRPHVPGYTAAYGILLDMVGARGAVFPLEDLSAEVAGDVQQKVWSAAARAGYGAFFPFVAGERILDDHEYVNRLTGIPTIDIIHLPPGAPGVFAPHWHTHADNLSIIDRTTLNAVGHTLLQVLREEGEVDRLIR